MGNNKKYRMKQYKSEIEPLIMNLKEVCRQLDMPMFVTVCVDTGENVEGQEEKENPSYESTYVNEMVSPYSCDKVKMKPDYVGECIKVINGFHVVSGENEVYDIDDLDTDLPDYAK